MFHDFLSSAVNELCKKCFQECKKCQTIWIQIRHDVHVTALMAPMYIGFCLCDSCHTGKGCNSECFHGGTCVNGTCICNDQWTGPKCTIPGCPGMCSGHGTCNSGDHIRFCTPGIV